MTEDATADIMAATHAALCEHGYAGLTTKRIAEESALSKSALHYHYDSKRDLLVAFLEHLSERYEERITDVDGEDPAEHLLGLVDTAIDPDRASDRKGFSTAIMEIRAQAPYDEAYRERLTDVDDVLHDAFAAALRDGQEAGLVVDDVDPEVEADFLVTAVAGTYSRHVAVGMPLADARDRLRAYVRSTLLTDEVAVA